MPGELHLVVDPAEEEQLAVLAPTDAVAGAVHAAAVEGVGVEALGGALGVVAVAAADPGAADPELARLAVGHRLPVLVEDVQGVAGGRLADRDRLADLLAHLVGRGEDRRLGRAVDVDQAGVREGGAQLADQGRAQDVAAGDEDPEPGELRQGDAGHLGQQAGREDRHRHLVVGDHLADYDRVGVPRRGDDKAGAVQHRRPDLQDRAVEVEHGLVEDAVVGGRQQVGVSPQQVDETAVGDLDALRGAGRARREEDAGEAVAPRRSGRNIRRGRRQQRVDVE